MTKRLSSARLEQLKRSAKRLAREQSIPLNVAQNRLALEQGYANFSLLVKDSRAKTKKEHQLLGGCPAVDYESLARDCLPSDLHKVKLYCSRCGRYETSEEVLAHMTDISPTDLRLGPLVAPPRTAMKSLCFLLIMHPVRLKELLRRPIATSSSYQLSYRHQHTEGSASASHQAIELSRDARVRLASSNTDALIEHVLSHGGIHPLHYYLPLPKDSLDGALERLDSNEHLKKSVDDNRLDE